MNFSEQSDIGATGRECAFVIKSRRQGTCRDARPRPTSVLSDQNVELSAYGISNDYAVVSVPERHRVKECPRVVVLELQFPVRAAVAGLVDARRGTVAYAQQVN